MRRMRYELKDKVVLITGGAAGIGRDLVIQAAQKGAKVVFCDVNQQNSKDLRVELKVKGLHVHPIICDISDDKQVEAMYAEIMKEYGRIDVLINNAAIQTEASIAKTTCQDFKKVIGVNLIGAFYCMKFAEQEMKPGSVMINIVSIYYNKARLNKYAYDAAKAGLASLTREFALELGSRDIAVNAIYPGFVMTPMQNDMSEEAYQKGISKNLLKQSDASTSKGFAEYVLSYIEDFSHATTGQILGVDAGRGL